ncbi:MAG: PBSX family phage terminase large subunit [Clostridia bacterium]|nr:PBSX family phage terminase large subunit [Clostridia bacterium]
MNEKRVYLPDIVGSGYGKFWRDTGRYRVLKGGKGSKKSTTTALNLIYRLMKYPDSNLLVVRAVMNTHRDSTFAQLKWAQERLGVSHLWHNTVSSMEMVYTPTGQKILFRGFDDVLKLASTTVSIGHLCWVWIEEAYELESEADFEKLDLSVPRGNIPPHLFKQTTLTFNPWSEHHWLKRRFFDHPSENISTYSTNYLCNEWLDATDKAVFEQMKERNYRRYTVAGLGEWGIAEGLVYENWEVLEFEADKLGVEDKTDWQYKHFFGLDYGYTNDPTAFIAFAANPLTRELYIYDEHYERKMLNCDIADMLKRKGYAKERIRADAAEPKSNEDLRRLGIGRITPSVKGKDSIINGIAGLQEYKIYVSPACKSTIAELSSYCWKKDIQTEKVTNEPEDSNNHLMDALRYAFYDVRFFKPDNRTAGRRTRGISSSNISGEDFSGEWS